MTARLVRRWLDSGRLGLPLPASGKTAERWRGMMSLAEEDVSAARIAEAHLDAVAILDELGGEAPQTGQVWGVWASEASDSAVTATVGPGGSVVLDGVKQWCSGAGICTHALVTAATADSVDTGPCLFAVAIDGVSVAPQASTWRNPGMSASDTRAVRFVTAPAIAIGEPGDYLARPGFWYGAIGVAACWLGGARRIAGPLYRRAAQRSADPHTLAHLGAVDSALAAGEAMLDSAAIQVDDDPFDQSGTAQLRARRVRAVAEYAVDEAITRSGRALGPGPLCQDGEHAQRVADLSIYIRQSHAEKDLAQLGRLVARWPKIRGAEPNTG